LLQSGCNEELEMRRVLTQLCAEAVEVAEWLREEVMEVFQVREEGVGCGSVTGETRCKLVEAREKTKAKLLSLSGHGDRERNCPQPGCLVILSHTLLCHMRSSPRLLLPASVFLLQHVRIGWGR
jgi:hypothetical protein